MANTNAHNPVDCPSGVAGVAGASGHGVHPEGQGALAVPPRGQRVAALPRPGQAAAQGDGAKRHCQSVLSRDSGIGPGRHGDHDDHAARAVGGGWAGLAALGRCDLAAGPAVPGAFSVRRRGARRWRGLRRHGGVARDDGRPAGRAGLDDGGLLGLGGGRNHRSRRPRRSAWNPSGVVLAGARPARACSRCWCWQWPRQAGFRWTTQTPTSS